MIFLGQRRRTSRRVSRRVTSTAVFLSFCLGLGLLAGCSSDPEPVPQPVVSESQESQWRTYADVDGDSDVAAYRVGPGFIEVRFDDGSEYLYTDTSAGAANIVRMQQLAAQGDGLGSFIQTNVHDAYESKS